MWEYIESELYHYGVLGMKWGVRRSRGSLNRKNVSQYKGKGLTVSQAARQAKTDKAKDKEYIAATKANSKTKRKGYGAIVAGSVMTKIGKRMYDKNKYNSTTGKTAAINVLGHGGKTLTGLGEVAVTSAKIRQHSEDSK